MSAAKPVCRSRADAQATGPEPAADMLRRLLAGAAEHPAATGPVRDWLLMMGQAAEAKVAAAASGAEANGRLTCPR